MAHGFVASSWTSSSCAISSSGGRRGRGVGRVGGRGGCPRERAMRNVGRENVTTGGIGGHGGHTARRNEVGTRREVGTSERHQYRTGGRGARPECIP